MFKKLGIVFVCAGVLFGLTALAPKPASADLTACNDYHQGISVAIAYYNKSDGYFISTGWYNIEPGYCKAVMTGNLDNRYYYMYATNYDWTWEWSGDYKFCADPDHKFTFYNAQHNCDQTESFREIDTGNYRSYTYRFH